MRNRKSALPSVEEVRQRLRYERETGVLTWINPPVNLLGRRDLEAGSRGHGYTCIRLRGVRILAHRAAWALMTGEWPTADIDHINGDGFDNRWANLRAAPGGINQQNVRRPNRDNILGFLGVSRAGKKYSAKLRHQGRTIYLGSYPTPEEAHAAYVAGKRQLHPGCTL